LREIAFISSASENTTPRNDSFSRRRPVTILRDRVAGVSRSSAV
jgi:hypothetical protein